MMQMLVLVLIVMPHTRLAELKLIFITAFGNQVEIVIGRVQHLNEFNMSTPRE